MCKSLQAWCVRVCVCASLRLVTRLLPGFARLSPAAAPLAPLLAPLLAPAVLSGGAGRQDAAEECTHEPATVLRTCTSALRSDARPVRSLSSCRNRTVVRCRGAGLLCSPLCVPSFRVCVFGDTRAHSTVHGPLPCRRVLLGRCATLHAVRAHYATAAGAPRAQPHQLFSTRVLLLVDWQLVCVVVLLGVCSEVSMTALAMPLYSGLWSRSYVEMSCL